MLDAGLKEWAVVCDLLLEGRLALLLRKGGIDEWDGPAVFKVEYPRFALWPSWAHQKPEMIKPEHRGRVELMDEPDRVTLRGMGEAARVWRVPSREAFDQLDGLHCWTPAQIDMRFNYRPEKPLWLMAVRVSRLQTEPTVKVNRDYAGCRSWVPFRPEDVVDDTGATPVLENVAFQAILDEVDRAMII